MSTIEIPVRHIASVWREYAQRDGVTDPAVELLAREVYPGYPSWGYRPAFRVPGTDLVVEIVSSQPHPSYAQALQWIEWMLERLHDNGNIQLHREAS
ncbi:hypothetical protein RSO41_12370 [Halomonas sp. I1]|uniref:hypothetical protein n=1 Tax=Halomonas sp. I1 TaxID=393536 RepID=UPI0028DF88E2|nr:hypothetical protein [Halomonas sp. I1]MDT8895451.1 hypothetical protein [Halomonas sp. I1]